MSKNPSETLRVVVIGAGAAGLASARHVAAAGFDCEVLEMAPVLGGLWVYTDDLEEDKYGFPVYSPMYKGLRTNLPKEVMGYPDFPVPEQDKSYLTQAETLEFLNQYADHFDLKRLIKFNRLVTEVRPLEDKWQVKSIDKPTKNEIVAIYDSVMVCNGHYNEPIIPELPNQEVFKGKVSHSYRFRSSDVYKDQRVLVIGAGPSGLDIALHISSVARYVVLSHHNKLVTDTEYPPNVTKKPDVLVVRDEEEVEFVDGSSCSFDAIVLCTGYRYSFPFLHESCGVTVDNNRIQPLYKHLVHIDKPTMCFIGVPYYVCAFQMFDLQARFYCKYLTGSMVLPPPEAMREDAENDFQRRLELGYSKKQAHLLGNSQINYFESLASAANIASVAPAICKLWSESERLLYTDLMNFREYRYKIVDSETYIKIC